MSTNITILLLCCTLGVGYSMPVHLRCESLSNPLGLDVGTPVFSWQSDNPERDWMQSGYQIRVASTPDLLRSGKPDIWDSGKQSSSESVGVPYGGPALESRRRYYWTVRVWDTHGKALQDAAPAFWEMGLLQKSDWKAQWIQWNNPENTEDQQGIRWISAPGQSSAAAGSSVVFRLEFDLAQMPPRAALFLIARGDWKVSVNGHDAGEKKGWLEFDRRDLNGLLVAGRNRIDVTVTVPEKRTEVPALAALVKWTNPNGTIERSPTNEKWEAKSGADFSPASVLGDLNSPQVAGASIALPEPAALFRREFSLHKKVASARAYVTALGSYRLYLNGRQVGRDVLTPGFTAFNKRVQYQTYDVTTLLANGRNAAGAVLGAGWFASGLSWTGLHFPMSVQPRFLAQIEIKYTDGSSQTIDSDESWKANPSPILHSEIYAGETYDARLEQPGWNRTGFNDAAWNPAAHAEPYRGLISSQVDTPPQVIQTLKPERVSALAGGTYVFDMGQNMVGWVALRVSGKSGDTVRMRFAEILNPDGSIYRTNLRNADATDSYTLRGTGEETFAPKFTFHGFRYVEVTGYPGTPTLASITGEVVSSVNERPAASLTTSSPLVNRMWNIGIWGQRGNFLSIPTDCPQRDERLGWMGDAGVFWRTGSYNFDIAAFTHKWMRDVDDAQLSDGAFTNVSPDIGVGTNTDGAPGWADAGVIVPWSTWMQYGDRSVIQRNWAAMERYMQFIEDANPSFLRTQKLGPNFGDWLAPGSNAPKDLIATAYWALVAQMMSEMAKATGNEAAAKRYSILDSNIRTAFQTAYIKPDGQIGDGSQTCYVLALHAKLIPPSLEDAAVTHLVKDIEAHGGHLTTGFLGAPFLLFSLSNHGRFDVAYRLLLTETYPSWGYMLDKGATTWWERWNGDTGDPAMNSYNHYAFGSVMAWVYRRVAGIDTVPSGAGFHEILIQPYPDARITSAKAEYDSAYGRITTDWTGTPSGPFTLHIQIPANTSARVVLPDIPNSILMEDGRKVSSLRAGLRVGSGRHDFQLQPATANR